MNIHNVFCESQVVAILTAASIALTDAKFAEKVGKIVDLSDADINNIQHKCQQLLEENL